MYTICIGLLLLASANARNWSISLQNTNFTIHKGAVLNVPFTVNLVSSNENINPEVPNILIKSDDEKIASVSTPSELKPFSNGTKYWNSSVDITGEFLGKTHVTINLQKDLMTKSEASKKILVVVIRPERLIDKLFNVSVITLVSILFFNFGCAMDWKACREALKQPMGPLIGSFCQIILMPLISFVVGLIIFPRNTEMQIALFFTGVSPSGGASNIWTLLLGGNLPLSISITTISTLAAFGTIPIWTFTLGKHIFKKGNLAVPYKNISLIAVGLIIPLAIGYITQRNFPKFSRIMVRIMKPFSVILILFIVTFAIATNFYLFELFSWQIIVAGMSLPWIGFISSYIIMIICRQPQDYCRAISIETGIENTGVSILLLRLSMSQPDADLTTVIPVSVAIMTPIPLTILWLIKIIFDRRKKKHATSVEKLHLDNKVSVLSPSDVPIITA